MSSGDVVGISVVSSVVGISISGDVVGISMLASLNQPNYNQFCTSSKYSPWCGESGSLEKKVSDSKNVTSIVT